MVKCLLLGNFGVSPIVCMGSSMSIILFLETELGSRERELIMVNFLSDVYP